MESVQKTGYDTGQIIGIRRDIVRAERVGNGAGHESVAAGQFRTAQGRSECLRIYIHRTPDRGAGECPGRLGQDPARGPVGEMRSMVMVIGIRTQHVLSQGVLREIDPRPPDILVKGHDHRRVLNADHDVGALVLDLGTEPGMDLGPPRHSALYPGPPRLRFPVEVGRGRCPVFPYVFRNAIVAVATDVAVRESDGGLVVQMEFPQGRQPDYFPQEIEVFRLVLRLKRAQPLRSHEVVAVQGGPRAADAHHSPFRMVPQKSLPVLHISGEYGHPQPEFLGPRTKLTHLFRIESLAGEFSYACLQGYADIRKPLSADPRHVVARITHLLQIQQRCPANRPFHPSSP